MPVRYWVYKVQMPCTECGEAVLLARPERGFHCAACSSPLELDARTWKNALSFRAFADEMGITEGRTRGSSITDGELRLLVRWGPQRPTCVSCGAAFAADRVAPGATAELPCGCGVALSVAAPPAWLREVVPSAIQLAEASAPAPVPSQTRPVFFPCPQCAASMTISAETPRISTCAYCDTDSYLPDSLWRALHPVRRRTPFWIAFDE